MAKKLTHPKHGVRKIYHVVLDKNLTAADLKKVQAGPTLEDGEVAVDEVAYIQGAPKKRLVLKSILGAIGWCGVFLKVWIIL